MTKKNKNKRKRKVAVVVGNVRAARAISAAAPRAHKQSATAVVPYQRPILDGNKAAETKAMGDVRQNTENNVFGLLSPIGAYQKGISPRTSDSTYRPTYTFTSRLVQNLALVANATNMTSDVYVELHPVGNGGIFIANAFASVAYPTGVTVLNDPTYAGWSSFIDRFRLVGKEFKLRNTSVVTSVGGVIAMGRLGANETPMSAHTLFGTFAVSPDVAMHSIGKPGDVFKSIWMPCPHSSAGTGTNPVVDGQFNQPATTSSAEDTVLMFWVQAPTSSGQTFELEVVSHYEAIIAPGQTQIYASAVAISDQTLASQLIAKALEKCPLTDQTRCVEQDDGDIISIAKDVATVFSAGKSIVQGAKKAWGWFKGLFSHHNTPERALHLMIHQGMTVALLRDCVKLADTLTAGMSVDHERAIEVALDRRAAEAARRDRLIAYFGQKDYHDFVEVKEDSTLLRSPVFQRFPK